MIRSIILGLITMATVTVIIAMFKRGRDEVVVPEGGIKGFIKKFRIKITRFFSGIGIRGFGHAAGVGAIVGVINYIVLTARQHRYQIGNVDLRWMSLIILIFMIWMMVHVVTWWHREGGYFIEMIPFILLEYLLFLTTKAAAIHAAGLFGWEIMSSFVEVIPNLLLVAAIGFFFIDYCYFVYRDEEIEEDEENRQAAHVMGIIGIVITTALLLWLLLSNVFADTIKKVGTGTPPETTVESTTKETAISKEEIDKAVRTLTVVKLTPEELEKLTLNKYKDISWVFLDSSLSTHDKERTDRAGFSDALTFGFDSSEEAVMFTELEEEILRNPVYGVTVVKAIMDKKIGDHAIKEFNPWMEEMVTKNQNGLHYWLEYHVTDEKTVLYATDKDTIYVTNEYRQYAATLCTWLERLMIQEVKARKTIENWCLNSASKNDERAGIKADYQYKKDALILAYVAKNDQALFEIGFNIHDKRPEFYGKPKDPVPETSPVETTPEETSPEKTTEETKPQKTTEETTPEKTTKETTPEETTKETTPEETTKAKKKDPGEAPSEDLEPQDDPGPGEDTSTGKGGKESSKDTPTGSGKQGSYGEYKEQIEELESINESQKTGDDPSVPTTTKPGAHVDDKGDEGGINIPTPTTDLAKDAESGETISTQPGGAWGGPSD